MNRRHLIVIGAAAIAAPIAARAQQAGKMFRLGILTLSDGETKSWMPGMLKELGELGFREGRNLAVDYASADDWAANLPKQAAKLIDKQPDVLVAGFGTLTAEALKTATSSVPVVFVTVGDPVGAGLVASLGRPGGNLTGFTDQAADIGGKRLSLLQDVTGGKKSFAVLGNPDTPYFAIALKEIEQAAATGKISLKVLQARSRAEVEKALDSQRGGAVGGVVVLIHGQRHPAHHRRTGQGVEARHHVPVARCRAVGWADVLRRQPQAQLRARRRVCRAHPARRQAGRPTGPAADQVRDADQPHHGQGDRTCRAARVARRRRRPGAVRQTM